VACSSASLNANLVFHSTFSTEISSPRKVVPRTITFHAKRCYHELKSTNSAVYHVTHTSSNNNEAAPFRPRHAPGNRRRETPRQPRTVPRPAAPLCFAMIRLYKQVLWWRIASAT